MTPVLNATPDNGPISSRLILAPLTPTELLIVRVLQHRYADGQNTLEIHEFIYSGREPWAGNTERFGFYHMTIASLCKSTH